MSLLTSIVIGVVQGFTEFLPVSSSGHLVIVHDLFGITPGLPFIVLMHLATLLAVFVYFWKDIIELASSFLSGAWTIISRKEPFLHIYHSDTLFKISCLLMVGTAATGVLAISFKDIFESFFSSVFAVGCFLILTAVIIFSAEFIGKGKRLAVQSSILDAVIIGLAQGLAIAPGLSRSGATVSAALARDFDRKFAARFSFLLSIPAILAAGLVEAKELVNIASSSEGLLPLAAGFISAAVSGYIAIKIFMVMIQRTSIRIFSYYTFVLGIVLVIFG